MNAMNAMNDMKSEEIVLNVGKEEYEVSKFGGGKEYELEKEKLPAMHTEPLCTCQKETDTKYYFSFGGDLKKDSK